MKKIKAYALSALTLIALFLIGSLMQSRSSQVKGVYSSPVTVMNPSSAPALGSSVDEPGRVPYVSQVALQGQNCSQPQGTNCQFNFSTVPAGHRLVIQSMSGFFQ